jgi:signal transduction histidine kinase
MDMIKQRNSSALRRMFMYSFPISLLCAIVIFAFFEWREYNLDRLKIDATLDNLITMYSELLGSPVWNLDEEYTNVILHSLKKFPAFSWAQVVLVDDEVFAQIGDSSDSSDSINGKRAISVISDSGAVEILGHLELGLSDKPFFEQQKRRVLNTAILIFVLMSTLILSFVTTFHYVISLPLARLLKAVTEDSPTKREADKSVTWHHNDELGVLVKAYNNLHQRHAESEEQLKRAANSLDERNKEKQRVQQQANRAKSEFISMVSHELRTPLTSIKGALALMKAGLFDKAPEKLPSIIDMAYRNTERLNYLINDILDIEKLNAGKVHFLMNPADLSALIEEAAVSNQIYGKQYGVTFVCSGTEEPLYVNGDHHRLIQVMANLLSNAAKFSPRGGQVVVTLVRHDGSLRVSVKDYGSGIPESARATIFDQFTQVDSTDQRQAGGSGLGLGIAKMIVEAHGGQIDFTSAADNGTTFYFDIPEL